MPEGKVKVAITRVRATARVKSGAQSGTAPPSPTAAGQTYPRGTPPQG